MGVNILLHFIGWMLAINLVFFTIGLLKITVFRGITTSVSEKMFGDSGFQIVKNVPKFLLFYWILIIVLNLTPYIAMHILIRSN
jgi:hypothetical protein